MLDLDHSEDPAHGPQELITDNGDYRSHCYLPLFLFEGLSGQLITAAWRPGQRPPGAENAMIVKRVMKRLRVAWPDTHIVLRGDGHFAHPERMAWVQADPHADFLCGLSHNAVLKALAQPFLAATRRPHEVRTENARRHHQPPPTATATDHELDYAAATWPPRFRVVLKAEVMALGDNPRFIVTALDLPAPQSLWRDLYGARGQDEIYQPYNLHKSLLAMRRWWRASAHYDGRRLALTAAVPVRPHRLGSTTVDATVG